MRDSAVSDILAKTAKNHKSWGHAMPMPPDNKFRILKKFSSSDIHQVFLAFDREHGCEVILKLGKDDSVRSLRRECSIVQGLMHPKVPKLIEHGDGFLALEYIRGEELGHHGQQDLGNLLDIGRQLAEILVYIHSKGIVYRDLKPSHLIRDPWGNIHLIDFEHAGKIGSREDAMELKGAPGTLHYAAPEILTSGGGRGVKIMDPRSDLYSLGVTLYEMWTGEVPFTGHDAMGLIHRIMHEPPLPMSRIRRGLPTRMEDLILCLLAKNPDKRMQFSGDVLKVMVDCYEQEGIRESKRETGRHLLKRPAFIARPAAWRSMMHMQMEAERGAGRICLIRGEKGIGKSRLLHEFRARYMDPKGMLVFRIQCRRHPTFSWQPLVSLLIAAVHCLGDTFPEELESVREQYGPDLIRFAPALREHPLLRNIQPSYDHMLSLGVLLGEVLQGVSRCGAAAVVLEDVQYLQDGCMDALRVFVQYYLQSSKTFFVATYADEKEFAYCPFLKMFAWCKVEGLAAEVILQRFSPSEMRGIIHSMTGERSWNFKIPDAFMSVLRGIPAAVVEAAQTLADDGALFRQGGVWKMNPQKIARFKAPRQYVDYILDAVRKLSYKHKEVLHAMAVLHQGITPRRVMGVTKIGVSDIHYIFGDLKNLGILHEITGYGLCMQDQVREQLYRQIPDAYKRTLHAKSAGELVRIKRKDKIHLPLIAGHYKLAGRPRQALPYLEEAALYSEQVGDLTASMAYCRDALECLGRREKHTARWVRLQSFLAAILLRRQQYREAVDAAKSTMLACPDKIDKTHALALLGTQASAELHLGHVKQSMKTANRMLTLSGECADMQSLIKALSLMGWGAVLQGHVARGAVRFEEQRELACACDDDDGIVHALLDLAEADLMQHQGGRAMRHVAQAVTMRRDVRLATVWRLHLVECECAYRLGDMPRMQKKLASWRSSCHKEGGTFDRARWLLLQGLLWEKEEDIGKADSSFQQSLDTIQAMPSSWRSGMIYYAYGQYLLRCARQDEALLRAGLEKLGRAQQIVRHYGPKSLLHAIDQDVREGESRLMAILKVEEQSGKRLQLFQKISAVIVSELNLHKLLNRIMDLTIEVLEAERGFLMLRDENDKFVFKAARNIDRTTEDQPEFKVSHTIVRRVALSKEAILVKDAQTDRRFRKTASVTSLKLRSILCVPILYQNKVTGVVYVDNSLISERFNEENLKLLVAFANQAAIAIVNARLHEENLARQAELAKSKECVEMLNKRLEEKILEQSIALEKAQDELKKKQHEITLKYNYDNIVGTSDRMKDVFLLLDRVTDTKVSVYLHGESGTGKELVAKAIHYNGPRKGRPFVSENCAAIASSLLETEIFGCVKGAFTGAVQDRKGLFEVADGGTLFLDEVAEMSPDLQSKLLRTLETGEVRPVGGNKILQVDVRIIAASNRDLAKMIQAGAFREDLYYRLNVIRVDLPPLRERREDIPVLCRHFLEKMSRETHTEGRTLTDAAIRKLMAYDWPGNVRELENAIKRAYVLCNTSQIPASMFAFHEAEPILDDAHPAPLKAFMEKQTREYIQTVMRQTGGKKSEAAAILGVERTTLYKMMKKLHID